MENGKLLGIIGMLFPIHSGSMHPYQENLTKKTSIRPLQTGMGDGIIINCISVY